MIVTLITAITTDLISAYIVESGNSIIKRIKSWFFMRKLNRWVCDFIIANEGSVLESSSFKTFIEKNGPLQQIFKNITTGKNCVSQRILIDDIIKKYDSLCANGIAVLDRSLLKEFFNKYYDQIDGFYLQSLTSNQKYMLGKIEQSNTFVTRKIDENSRALLDKMEDFSQIREMLATGNELKDYLEIYKILSGKVLEGKISEVNQFLPLLKNRCSDLENGIPMLIDVLKGGSNLSEISREAETVIEDDSIYSSIARVIVYIALIEKNINVLTSIGSRNKALYDIVGHLQAEKYDSFFIQERENQDGIECITFKVLNNYPQENWLVQRICMIYALNEQYYIKNEYLDSIIPLPSNIIDRILVAERKTAQMTVHYTDTDIGAKELYEDIHVNRESIKYLSQEIQIKHYVALLRLGHILSDDTAESIISEIPESIKTSEEIEELIAFTDVKKGTADELKIINICMKNDRYWLLYDYLLPIFNTDYQAAKNIIEKYLFVIDKEFMLFLMYYRIMSSTSEKDNAEDLLKKYEAKYGQYYEYWIERINLTKDENVFRMAFDRSQANQLEFIDKGTPYTWVAMMNEHREYDHVVELVDSFEKKGFINQGLKYQKAYALQATGHEIESLFEYTSIFNDGNRSDFVIYQIIYLSLANHRVVEQSILECADKSDNPDILSALAFYYSNNAEKEKALICIKKALLRTHDVNSRAFGYFINLKKEDLSRVGYPKSVDVDTVVHLKNINDNSEQIITINNEGIIPEDNYVWNGDTHVNKDTAIILGLYRLTKGETIKLQENDFTVDSIEYFDDYLLRLCFQKIVANGTAKTIKLSMTDDGKPDLQAFAESVKEIVGETDAFTMWRNNYLDYTSMPVPFYAWSKTSQAKTYQLVSAVFNDPQIVYRENSSIVHSDSESFVLSYAAMIVLYKLCWTIGEDSPSIVIPKALNSIVNEETNAVINSNNSDHVASMGIKEGNLVFSESQEDFKRKEIMEAVSIKKFCEKFESKENALDLHLPDDLDREIRDTYGVADYDAISLAKANNITLVSAEVPLSLLSSVKELNIDCVNIADFLSESTADVFTLLDYIYALVKHRFTLAITDKIVNRVADEYEKLTYQDKKVLLEKWEAILAMPLSDEEYCKLLSSSLFQNVLIKNKDSISNNQVMMILYIYVYKYMGYTLTIDISEKGINVSLKDTKEHDDVLQEMNEE